jgi:hypothetical protein
MKLPSLCLIVFAAAVFGQPAARPPATPLDPIDAIVAAFRSHSIVAIGNVEFRGNEQSHAFRSSLIRDPRIAGLVQDIVVEFGNARYQGLMDRFTGGEEVPRKELQKIWQDTTQIEFEWDLPIYEEFFRAIRDVNLAMPPGKPKLRVLLGDPPIDWATIASREDLDKVVRERDSHAAEVLKREVISTNRRALLLYGGGHLFRHFEHSIVSRLGGTAKIFVVLPETRRDLGSIQPGADSWPVPSLAILKGTILGGAPWSPRGGPLKLEDQADAILYLGPPTSMRMSQPTKAMCEDRNYLEKRLFRLGLVPFPPGAPVSPTEMLKKACATFSSIP